MSNASVNTSYHSVTGVAVGALNARLIAEFGEGEELAASKRLSNTIVS